MNFYLPLLAENAELAHPQDGDFEALYLLPAGVPKLSEWKPVRMRLIRFEDDGSPRIRSDAPWLGSHTLVLRSGTVLALRDILEANGELLPVECDDAKLFLFNATRLLDVLIEDQSEIVRFSTGRIMTIHKYVFREDRLGGVDCFKLPQLRVSPIFVSTRFVEAWRSAGLHGLEFTPVWSSEGTV